MNLSLITEGQKKTLIPCYYGLSPKQLPKELSNLQGQDLSKLGSMQDLIYGIKKIIKPVSSVRVDENKEEEKITTASNSSYDSLIRKGYTYLKNHEYEEFGNVGTCRPDAGRTR